MKPVCVFTSNTELNLLDEGEKGNFAMFGQVNLKLTFSFQQVSEAEAEAEATLITSTLCVRV